MVAYCRGTPVVRNFRCINARPNGIYCSYVEIPARRVVALDITRGEA